MWFGCSWVDRNARGDPQFGELEHLARMVQVSLVGYAVSGAFLGLAYFDLYYTLIAFIVVAKRAVVAGQRSRVEDAAKSLDEDSALRGRALIAGRLGRLS